MDYALSILVMAAILAGWGIAYSRWNKRFGGCGHCAAPGDPNAPGTCCMDRQPACPDDDQDRPQDS